MVRRTIWQRLSKGRSGPETTRYKTLETNQTDCAKKFNRDFTRLGTSGALGFILCLSIAAWAGCAFEGDLTNVALIFLFCCSGHLKEMEIIK